jgi:flagellar assembly protein FliH
MAKTVFRNGEITMTNKRVTLDPPQAFPGYTAFVPPAAVEELAEVEEYAGPTADDLRREAEAFKANWEKEKETLVNAAKAEAEAIVKDAEAAAFQEVKRKTDQAQAARRSSEDESERIIADAKREAAAIEARAQANLAEVEREAQQRGFAAGREAGFAEGRSEVERLVERVHAVLERAQEKRSEILSETEQQVIDLVLLVARKVIKVISENQRNVVVSNVVQALRKVKGRGDITVRVNIDDLKLTTEHVKDFIRLIEGVKNITVIEDGAVDRGGCVIETEFGEIDARISSQLAELEQKILEVSPITSKARAAPVESR